MGTTNNGTKYILIMYFPLKSSEKNDPRHTPVYNGNKQWYYNKLKVNLNIDIDEEYH